MKPKFEIKVDSFKTIHKLPASWVKKDLINILELVDFDVDDSNSKNDLYDYISMAFEELEPEEAAFVVLKYALGGKLNDNQLKEIAQEMQEENLWEEYGDMSIHEDLFKITSFLYHAYNGKFPHPDAAHVILKVNALNHDGEIVLKSIDEKLIARIISQGMSEHAVIYRLFHENIKGGDWTEAKDIIWQYSTSEISQKSIDIEITTAIYWVKELKNLADFHAELLLD